MFQKGQKRLPAKEMNYMHDAAKVVHDSFLSQNQYALQDLPQLPFLATVKNNTGESLFSYSVLSITGVSIPEKESEARSAALNSNIVLTGEKPTGIEDVAAITLSSSNGGECVYAVLSGPAAALIDILDTSHQYAVTIAGDSTKLQSSETGTIRILGGVSETGERFLPVLLGTPSTDSSAPTLSGVVMEAIHRTPDVTSDPADYVYGKIRVLGDESGALYDCANLYLAETEVAVVGLQLELLGPFQRKNPNYVPPDPEPEEPVDPPGEEPEYITYYLVKDWDQEWYAEIAEDLYGMSSTVVDMLDVSGDDPQTHQMTVWNDLFTDNHYFESGTRLRFLGEVGPEGHRLVVVGDACPVEDPAPTPEEST